MEILNYVNFFKEKEPVGIVRYMEYTFDDELVSDNGYKQLKLKMNYKPFEMIKTDIKINITPDNEKYFNVSNIDGNAMISGVLRNELRHRITKEIITKINFHAKTFIPKVNWFNRILNKIYKRENTLVLPNDFKEQVNLIFKTIMMELNGIFKATKIITKPFIITSPRIATLLQDHHAFHLPIDNQQNYYQTNSQVYVIGKIANITILVDSSQIENYLIVGLGSDQLGGIYYVYDKSLVDDKLELDVINRDGSNTVILKHSYAIVEANSEHRYSKINLSYCKPPFKQRALKFLRKWKLFNSDETKNITMSYPSV